MSFVVKDPVNKTNSDTPPRSTELTRSKPYRCRAVGCTSVRGSWVLLVFGSTKHGRPLNLSPALARAEVLVGEAKAGTFDWP